MTEEPLPGDEKLIVDARLRKMTDEEFEAEEQFWQKILDEVDPLFFIPMGGPQAHG